MNAHYFFPPAAAYPLNRALFRLKSDPEYRQRFAADREAAMARRVWRRRCGRRWPRSTATVWSASARIPISSSWPSSA